jgi:hypothetical protein
MGGMDAVGPTIALLAGLMFLTIALGNRNYERHRRSRGVVVPGRIVDSEWDMNSTGAVFQAPVVEYVGPDGSPVRFVHRSGTSFKPSVGANVGVWYDPSTGEGPVLHEDRPMQFIMVLFGVLGATVSAGALVMLVRALV